MRSACAASSATLRTSSPSSPSRRTTSASAVLPRPRRLTTTRPPSRLPPAPAVLGSAVWTTGSGGTLFCLSLRKVIQKLGGRTDPVVHHRCGARAHHFLEPFANPIDRIREPQPVSRAQPVRQIERVVRRWAPCEQMVGDGAE